jgi:hypothetical protein
MSDVAYELGRFAILATVTPMVFDLAWSLFVRLSK